MAKTRLTVRLVIGVLCVTLVVIVAVITLAITYTVSLATVRDIGRNYAKALALSAKLQTEDYFNAPLLQATTAARFFEQSNFNLPVLDPLYGSLQAHEKYFQLHFGQHSNSNFTFVSSGIAFDEGSGHTSYFTAKDTFAFVSRFAMAWPNGNMQLFTKAVNITSGLLLPNPTQVAFGNNAPLINFDARIGAVVVAKQLAGTNRLGMWYPVSVFAPLGTPFFVLPLAQPLYNYTGQYVGILAIAQDITAIKDFLATVKSSSHTEAFALDQTLFIIAGTTTTPTYTVQQTNITGGVLADGCSNSAATNVGTDPYTFIACRANAATFSAYPPLQSVAQQESSDSPFLIASNTQVRLVTIGSSNYFVASANVNNGFRFFKMNVALFMPEDDILGDLVTGRNTAIGITAAVCVLAAALSFLLVYILLQPLATVSRNMQETARLRDAADEGQLSSLAEIQDLQKSYSNMNNAIKSFTRYVPRDVVKMLMRSGQLCTINMTPQRCTMLFVDIAGFTTICERVPADVLSGLVSQYFDRASRIVMEHDGLIDKFIGDCIMAVWGAPFPTPNQEVKATITGKLIDRETIVQPLASQWDEAGEQLRVRVGISTGVVLAGNMGSEDRMSYTVIGDPVNLAARLESMNKQFGTRVMVSEMTAENLGNIFVLRLLLPIAVVGKEEPVKVFEVMGLQRQLDTADHDRIHAGETMEVEKITKRTTDSFSISESQASTISSSHAAMRRGNRTTIQMIRDAQMKTSHEGPVTCTEEEITFAHRHTDAVLAYMRKDFRGALNMFLMIHKNTPPHILSTDVPIPSGQPLRSCTSGKSVAIVEKLCEEYAVHCPADFDGVYRALEK